MLQVGIGKSGILRVSSGSDNSVNPARNRWAPNAVTTNKTQHKSKMSELAHANIGKIYCITNTNRSRAMRTIGETQSSCVKPDCWRYPRRNGRGEVVGDVLISVHAKCGKYHQTNERADSVQRAIGKMQSSRIDPERQQSPWHQVQGGVVGRWRELGQGPRLNPCSHCDSSVQCRCIKKNICSRGVSECWSV